VAGAVSRYVTDLRADLPAGVSVKTWADRSVLLEGRIDLLTRNATIGLVLVFLSLSIFLEWKLAFWTMMGIPISFLGAFWVLPLWGVTINMISLFAFIVVLGIVVDDAIVVGENIFAYRQKGMETHKAAVKGVMEMAAPVTFAIATTVVAFLPLLYTKGMMGKMMKVIPLAVICVLLFSLVEALLILPAHLADPRSEGVGGWLERFHSRVNAVLQWVIHKPYVWLLERAVSWRYVTVAVMASVLLVTVSLIFAGKIKTSYLPHVDADNVVAEVELPRGAPVEHTRAVLKRLEPAAMRDCARIDEEHGGGGPSLIQHVNTTIGQQPYKALSSGRHQGGVSYSSSSHLAEVNLELLTSEERSFPSGEIANLWREEAGSIAGVSSLTFISTLITAGEAVNIEFSHRDFDKLLGAVELMKERLNEFVGVYDINDSFVPGKRELKLSLTPEGRSMGLTLAMLARQVRQGFYGEEAQRVQRDRDDIKVMVRYPEEERRSLSDIESMRVRLPNGAEAPFEAVAEVVPGRGFASINRTGRQRVVSVTADVDQNLANADEVNAELFATVLPELMREVPGLSYRVKGSQEDRQESMSSMANNFGVAVLAIYVLLGVQFRSYIQPLIVMSAIPFGFVGAVGGHLLMGLEMSFVSFFGCVALAGVVVNDALIMVDVLNKERAKGQGLKQTVLMGGVKRFRPIMLTTFTTFCGLSPMLLERSLQAKFLVPMAVSLAFGVMFATLITLILVPSLYVILEDFKGLVRTGFGRDDGAIGVVEGA
ncbi:MAG: efflux RND transporter permease subunit, partial [Planctomycetota bacterium]|jgi:multidrug efflux pump subunit AcrB